MRDYRSAKPDERGRYEVCPECGSKAIACTDEDVAYLCGSKRPDGDPEGSYSTYACEIIHELKLAGNCLADRVDKALREHYEPECSRLSRDAVVMLACAATVWRETHD